MVVFMGIIFLMVLSIFCVVFILMICVWFGCVVFVGLVMKIIFVFSVVNVCVMVVFCVLELWLVMYCMGLIGLWVGLEVIRMCCLVKGFFLNLV